MTEYKNHRLSQSPDKVVTDMTFPEDWNFPPKSEVKDAVPQNQSKETKGKNRNILGGFVLAAALATPIAASGVIERLIPGSDPAKAPLPPARTAPKTETIQPKIDLSKPLTKEMLESFPTVKHTVKPGETVSEIGNQIDPQFTGTDYQPMLDQSIDADNKIIPGQVVKVHNVPKEVQPGLMPPPPIEIKPDSQQHVG